MTAAPKPPKPKGVPKGPLKHNPQRDKYERTRDFAVAKVELTECVPSSVGVNHEAVRTINSAQARFVGRFQTP